MKNGIIIYDINKNGCLNGIYTNENEDGKIYNEIAYKLTNLLNPNDIIGEYNCTYFEGNGIRLENKLNIERCANLYNTYKFTWSNLSNKTIFNGIGYKMTETTIAVRYDLLP